MPTRGLDALLGEKKGAPEPEPDASIAAGSAPVSVVCEL